MAEIQAQKAKLTVKAELAVEAEPVVEMELTRAQAAAGVLPETRLPLVPMDGRIRKAQ